MAFFIVYKGHKEHYWKCEKSLLFVIKLTETENTKKQRGRKNSTKAAVVLKLHVRPIYPIFLFLSRL